MSLQLAERHSPGMGRSLGHFGRTPEAPPGPGFQLPVQAFAQGTVLEDLQVATW